MSAFDTGFILCEKLPIAVYQGGVGGRYLFVKNGWAHIVTSVTLRPLPRKAGQCMS